MRAKPAEFRRLYDGVDHARPVGFRDLPPGNWSRLYVRIEHIKEAGHDRLQARLAGLVLPNSPHVVKAGEYLEHLGLLWSVATLEEQREITQVLIKACHVDVVQKRIIAIEPLPLFKQLFMEFFADIGVVIL